MATDVEIAAMRRALELAARGRRSRNPQVGAVILDPSGQIIAEGWHHGAGTAHAEVDALSHLPAEDARGATAVVTLEPCNHRGRTGPCAEALIEAGVARVVYALDDPGEHEGGGGARLRSSGIDVEGGVLEADARALLDPWLTARRLGRPFVTIKWAQSLDGRAAAADGSSQWITGPAARADVHRRRSEADAIVVGTGTLVADDPALTARDGDALLPDQPVPVVIGATAVPEDARIHEHPHAPLVYATRDLDAVLDDLAERGLHRVFVEGGPTLASAFLAHGLADRILAYIAPTLLGGPRSALADIGVGAIADQRRLEIETIERLGDDLLVVAVPQAAVPRRPTTDSSGDAPSGRDAARAPDGPLTADDGSVRTRTAHPTPREGDSH
ncbi:bifunctional diaminohydroxyphosphoribosylaminopyrimidine deaminase/5-amino-6-(5-phosphoribosylamino)uracil reductase RibD [Microbacterium karelineae]|uniref:bifunctional diaminohydroxyphosphoribosylaminopyrimidine deaminase/5-amino-6-(5-phosphoribosylamino)uracil reductase RibD n=1 Tax=Microbacterium karelineae TaxID=2654283 RepID=UPI0012EA82F1|nr:bifunctional diaminohydroxyphosphoribosylaminopyrimidine deaminase/5-amino-6-(5-phosphoribosylamino)uracil reductase RibD [Microbacterium karelineae]